jgi:hypothetical protein
MQRASCNELLWIGSHPCSAIALRIPVAATDLAAAVPPAPPQEHESNERFNPGWLEDDNERVVLEEIGSCITALCAQPGRVVLTQSRIYFQPFNVVSNAPIQTYQLDKVSRPASRACRGNGSCGSRSS